MTSNTLLRTVLCLSILLALSSGLTAVEIGSTYREVVLELGRPDGELSSGKRQILTYGKAKVTLNDGKVVSFSPEWDALMAERNQNKADVEAKRNAGLVNHQGKWVRASDLEKELAEKADEARKAQSSGGSGGSGGWLTDYDAAMKLAKAEKKKVLLNFTGSDWCGWCIRLDREVFSQKEFLDYAADNYVLVKLDFPQRSKLPAKLQKQNESLAQKFGIRGFPTIVVLNDNGKVHKQGGYVEGGPKAFIRSLR
jgi:protein disulfide-isomerase